MRRQQLDGTYKWLGIGRGMPRGEILNGTTSPTGRPMKAYYPKKGTGRKRRRAMGAL